MNEKKRLSKLEQDKINRLKAKERKLNRMLGKSSEKATLYELCRQATSLYGDKRYEGVKTLLTMRMFLRKEEREQALNTCKTEFEYIKRVLVCDTEINLLNDILNIPDDHKVKLEKLQEDELKSKEKDNGKHL